MSTIKDLYELSLEINSISLMLTGLSNTLEPECDHLTEESFKMALWGVSSHLDRIAKDLDAIGEKKSSKTVQEMHTFKTPQAPALQGH